MSANIDKPIQAAVDAIDVAISEEYAIITQLSGEGENGHDPSDLISEQLESIAELKQIKAQLQEWL